ncbi:sulfonate ABC transporter ATP-binding protein [Actinoplanes sp. SE50]|uniref:pullulanase-type alpha-1,6-glucosidase n=1 Tax=unclassified Actinoplanes TaxID=2626549 RepID=UPI00023ED2ED|nr:MULTISPECIES: pullulanase-type alpha-1,6-glucosidase [unclassified Actinoplanes]AEV87281.1 alpha-1,6-glucosidase, pullulanase-type [Actinoplanes sp. SE50/110]ATO85681.1 sulfonate ABC transporter ATP-binding protein [Actinoplanes sp. SE50]SLM03094.1 Pullulanase, alpha-amylase [Actinoplanes sp. SE50/110]
MAASKTRWGTAVLSLLLPLLTVPAAEASAASNEPSASVIANWGSDKPASNEQYYFVLPDRFANGEKSNDKGGLTGDRLSTGYDPADKGFYHGGDLKGVIDKLDYIQGLGTTAIWLAPVFKNRPVQGTGADVSAGYHGYWITDFTQVDPHFGTNADLKKLVQLAHRRGMKIFLDIIVNHTADVIKNRENKYSYIDKATSPYTDTEGQPFEDKNYATGRNGFPKVDATSFPYTPTVDPKDKKVKVPAWLNDVTMYHNRGDSTFSGENSEYGDFYGLDDLWTERPEVVRGMTRIYADWIGATGIDGYRLDTVKHTDLDFWPQFTAGINQAAAKAGKPGFFMFGEVYSADQEIESTYVRKGGLPATLDFSFQAAAQAFVTGGGTAAGLSDVYAKDDLYTTPTTSAERLPTFLGNHDMGRIGSFIAAASTADTQLKRDELAHELMFLTRGQPVVYSGDEQGFTGPGGDKDARQDMFASKTADYLKDDLIGTDRTHAVDNYDTAHPLYRTIASLAKLRKANPALVDGVQVTRYAATGAGVLAVSRIDRTKRTEYVVAANNATTTQTVSFATSSPGATFTGIYGGAAPVVAGADGKVTVTVPALSTVVLRSNAPEAVPAAAPTVTLKPAAGAKVATRTELTAETTGDPLATVTFAAQVGDGPWKLLGTADRAPYRVYHDLDGLAGGTPVKYKAVVRDSRGRLASSSTSITVATPTPASTVGYAIVHYQRPAGGYADYGLYTWGDVDPSMSTSWPNGQPFVGEDAYGRFAYVKLAPNAKSMGFIVVGKDGVKDTDADRSLDPTKNPEVWLKQGDPAVYTTPPAVQQDQGKAIIHWRRADGNYDGWGLHVWDGAATGTDWGSPLKPTKIDSYGATFEVPLADGAAGLSYIIHNGDAKDLPTDQRLTFADAGHEVWLLAGQQERLLPLVKTAGGTGSTDVTKESAVWMDRSTLAWQTGGSTDGKVYDLVWSPTGGIGVANGELTGDYKTVSLHAKGTGLTERQRDRFPHLWQYRAFTTDARNVADIVRGQVVVTERNTDGRLLAATGVQTAGVLDDLYPKAVDAELGYLHGRVAVWAPTASSVELETYDNATASSATLATMKRDDRTGVWSLPVARGDYGKYYRFRVTAWQPAAQKVVTASVTDPYSVALSTDSKRSRFLDLNDPKLAPAGWDRLRKPAATAPAKIQIQELSVRDFSIADSSVPAAERGTYAAFTEARAAGVRHLADLGKAGVTHVHLLPVFDFATVPENRADQAQPGCDLAALPADSDQQQACVAKVAGSDGYNWGYDPLHYTVPEGSYAVDPADRTREFRSMVAGINNAGLRVVMDVVYNHTSAAGTDPNSVLDQIVPGYYQRLLADGTVADSTCCANTAPENAMMGKLVVDSVVTWAKQYKVDGFRFDLMGHHPKANILAVRKALDKLTLKRDGVDGKNIYVYGEGWNFGEVANNARFVQATQQNMAGTGIGTFNDRLRDAVRGGGPFDDDPRIQGFASGLADSGTDNARLLHYQDLIKVGLTGNLAGFAFTGNDGKVVTGKDIDYNGAPAGYTAAPDEAITYVDAHDNEILYDALAYKLPQSTTAADRARMQSVALATTVLGQGVGFVAAGSERLRSKSLDRNSFNSGDWFNAIEWDCTKGNGFGKGLPPAADNQAKWQYAKPLLADPALKPDCAAINLADNRYRELLRIRTSSPVFGLATGKQVQQRVAFPLSGKTETPGVITMTLDARGLGGKWKSITVVFNSTSATATQTLPALAGKKVALHPVQQASADPLVRTASFAAATGTFRVPARTVSVFVQN